MTHPHCYRKSTIKEPGEYSGNEKKETTKHSPPHENYDGGDDGSEENKTSKGTKGDDGPQVELGTEGLATLAVDGERDVDVGNLAVLDVGAAGDFVVLGVAGDDDLRRRGAARCATSGSGCGAGFVSEFGDVGDGTDGCGGGTRRAGADARGGT